ncbi:hypothetical protein [Bacterioplanoides pacificum]|uniref:Uncharacterized protein n=1 Tax=Bacterioplanoides pacificum TaxID=1171596 RepID=A0ABV7VTX7_9GAMM
MSQQPDQQPGWRARLRHWLMQRARNDRANLRLFVTGAALFFGGLGILLYAEQRLLASLTQELIAAAGLLFAACGAVLATLGYLALSLLRILRFISDDD